MSYLDVRDVSKTIRHDTVLSHVSFSVDRGQVVGLEGRNGSGKTMAMRVVCGLVRPSEGEVEVGGRLLWTNASFPESVGLLIEAPALLDLYPAMDNLRMLASIKGVAGEEDLRRAIERVGLLPDDHRRVGKYSLGMRQKLGIAMAIMEAPDLLVLDEPTNALDEESRGRLAGIIGEERDRGAAVLLSSHDPDFLSGVCDATYHMDVGEMRPSGGQR